MKVVLSCCTLALATLLAGCATPPAQDTQPASQPAPTAAEKAQPLTQNDTITGSRIPARHTEKMVSAVSAQDYKESTQILMAPLRSQ